MDLLHAAAPFLSALSAVALRFEVLGTPCPAHRVEGQLRKIKSTSHVSDSRHELENVHPSSNLTGRGSAQVAAGPAEVMRWRRLQERESVLNATPVLLFWYGGSELLLFEGGACSKIARASLLEQSYLAETLAALVARGFQSQCALLNHVLKPKEAPQSTHIMRAVYNLERPASLQRNGARRHKLQVMAGMPQPSSKVQVQSAQGRRQALYSFLGPQGPAPRPKQRRGTRPKR